MDLALEHLDVQDLDVVEAPLGFWATVGVALGAGALGAGIGYVVAGAIIT